MIVGGGRERFYLDRDGRILFATRAVRLFAYGFLSVFLVIYLTQIGLRDLEIGLLLSLTLVGDTIISLLITTKADRAGRKKMLALGAVLMLFAGVVFVLTNNFLLLLFAAIFGVISPSGNEVGPFLSIEQSSLTQIIPNRQRTRIFAWYNLLGSFATASGAMAAGLTVQTLLGAGASSLDSYRFVIVVYAALGIILLLLFLQLTSKVEVKSAEGDGLKDRFGLHKSRKIVFKLSALFSLDAFGGGFIVQSVMAAWFFLRFGTEPALLGTIFFAANILAGMSALIAVKIAERVGLIRTMVYTHLPSNVLLILVPLMPDFNLALFVLLVRFSISQMDVPTRQSYVIAVVSEDERSAAAGITQVSRTVGSSAALFLIGILLVDSSMLSYIFFIAGGVKIAYDIALYISFRSIRPSEEDHLVG